MLFGLRFALVFAALYGLSSLPSVLEQFRKPYCEILATTLGQFFSGIGMEVQYDGPTVMAGGGGVTIIPSCDGVILLCLFAAAVLATPWMRALRPYLLALAGLTLLVGINWVRLVILAIASFRGTANFDFLHHIVLQGALVLCVAGLFFIWLQHLPLEADSEVGDS